MSFKVGKSYGEASATHVETMTINGIIVEVTYNVWERYGEDCVTQRVDVPTNLPMGHASFYEWLGSCIVKAKAVERAGFYARGSMDNAIIWSRRHN